MVGQFLQAVEHRQADVHRGGADVSMTSKVAPPANTEHVASNRGPSVSRS